MLLAYAIVFTAHLAINQIVFACSQDASLISSLSLSLFFSHFTSTMSSRHSWPSFAIRGAVTLATFASFLHAQQSVTNITATAKDVVDIKPQNSAFKVVSQVMNGTNFAFCTSNLSCGADAVCYEGRCKCNFGFVWNETMYACMRFDCRRSAECRSHGFEHSACHHRQRKCVCKSSYRLSNDSQMCVARNLPSPNRTIIFVPIGVLILLCLIGSGGGGRWYYLHYYYGRRARSTAGSTAPVIAANEIGSQQQPPLSTTVYTSSPYPVQQTFTVHSCVTPNGTDHQCAAPPPYMSSTSLPPNKN